MNNLEENKRLNEDIQPDQNDIKKDQNKKGAAKKRKKCRGFFGTLAYIADCISKALQNGFLGFLFADLYDKLNGLWKKSSAYKLFSREKKRARTNARIARVYESTQINKLILGIGNAFVRSYVRIFGIAMFSFAMSVVLIALFRYYLFDESILNRIVVGTVMAFCSLPFIISKKRVGEALLEGRLLSFIIHQVLGLDDSKLDFDENSSGGSYLIAFEIGMVLGFTTFFYAPWIAIAVIAVALAITLVMCFPELGIMMILISIPFVNIIEYSSVILLAMITITFASFLFKLIRGKRIVRIEIIDIVILLFAVMLLVSGLYTRGGVSSVLSTWIYLGFLCVYFLVVNSYIRKTWIYRGCKLISVVSAIVAVVGLVQGGELNSAWVDSVAFPTIELRVTSFFDNPNMLGSYLVIVLPFALANMINCRKFSAKALYFICFAVTAVCLVMTWSRGAWLGALVCLVVFFLMYNFRSIWLVVLGAAALPAIAYMLPQGIIDRFLSIFTFSDSSTLYRLSIWKGSFAMIKDNLLGIGVGESAFKAVFPNYAPQTTQALHAHSLYLQILVELGIIGAIVFGIIMLMYTQKCLGAIKQRRRGSKSRTIISAGFAGILGALVAGLSDHIWYNYRVFLIFWMVIALTISLSKINERESFKAREMARVDENGRSASLEIEF